MKQNGNQVVDNQDDEVWAQIKAKMKEVSDSELNSSKFFEVKMKTLLKGENPKPIRGKKS